jgi:hypothetical protein
VMSRSMSMSTFMSHIIFISMQHEHEHMHENKHMLQYMNKNVFIIMCIKTYMNINRQM